MLLIFILPAKNCRNNVRCGSDILKAAYSSVASKTVQCDIVSGETTRGSFVLTWSLRAFSSNLSPRYIGIASNNFWWKIHKPLGIFGAQTVRKSKRDIFFSPVESSWFIPTGAVFCGWPFVVWGAVFHIMHSNERTHSVRVRIHGFAYKIYTLNKQLDFNLFLYE